MLFIGRDLVCDLLNLKEMKFTRVRIVEVMIFMFMLACNEFGDILDGRIICLKMEY